MGRLEGAEREALADLIDAYYVDAPLRRWDPDAFRGSPAEKLTDELDRSFRGRSGLWPAVLPRLRHRAKIMRDDLVARLADALGVGDRAERVGDYYHQMEQGRLPSDGVSDRVLEALAGVLGTTAEALRRAGRSLAEDVGEDEEGTVYARTARPDPAYSEESAAAPARAKARETGPDEVDELFTGGSDGA